MVEYLLDHCKCDIEGKTKYDGRTPLIFAALGDHPELVKMLLAKGAKARNIDMVRGFGVQVRAGGQTACRFTLCALLSLLLHGTQMGMTALDYAEAENKEAVLSVMKAANRAKLWALRARRRLRNKRAKGEGVTEEELKEADLLDSATLAVGTGELSLDTFEDSGDDEDDDGGGVRGGGTKARGRARGGRGGAGGGGGDPSAFSHALSALRGAANARATRAAQAQTEVEEKHKADSELGAGAGAGAGQAAPSVDDGLVAAPQHDDGPIVVQDDDDDDSVDDTCDAGGLDDDVTVRSIWATNMLEAAKPLP